MHKVHPTQPVCSSSMVLGPLGDLPTAQPACSVRMAYLKGLGRWETGRNSLLYSAAAEQPPMKGAVHHTLQ